MANVLFILVQDLLLQSRQPEKLICIHLLLQIMAAVSAEYAALALFIASVVVFAITIAFAFAARRNNAKFWDLIREKDWYASLSRFQLLWFWIIGFSFLGVFVIRRIGGEPAFPSLPDNVLLLLGVVAAPAVASSAYNAQKLQQVIRKYNLSVAQLAARPNSLPRLSTMLMEKVTDDPNDPTMKPTTTRFQMFAWTFIAIIIYLVIFFSTISSKLSNIEDLTSVPDINLTLVTLMGLSQGVYVAGKFANGT